MESAGTSHSLSILQVSLPDEVVERGARLLHQQCWLWGIDLRSERGNLLLQCGLQRLDGGRGSGHRTRYGGEFEHGRFAVLWSGGFCFGGAAGTLVFPRLRFAPVLLPEVNALTAVPSFPAPPEATGDAPDGYPARAMLPDALRWLAGYEEGVLATVGLEYRRECEAEWERIEREAGALASAEGVEYTRVPAVAAGTLAEEWRRLAQSLARP
jgi:hypothetical protein